MGDNNQLWSISNVGGGHYELLNNVSGKALDVAGYSSANGGTVDQWTYSGGTKINPLRCTGLR